MSDRVELLTAHLQRHCDPATIPESAHETARVWLYDSIGVAIAGRAVAQSPLLLSAVRKWGQGNDAQIWGSVERLPTASAALLNAFHIHNQEYDCVHEKAVVHPMAVILAALLSYAESVRRQRKITGREFTTALVLAVDVATVVGMSARRAIRFFRPAQCGCLGAVAGLSVLAGLDEATTRDAFGLAYSQLAGTMQAHIEGTPTLALQVGFAARAAVCALDVAQQGFRAPHQILDGKYGYFALYETDAVTIDAADCPFHELGKVWQVEQVSHKPFPTGRAAQGGIAGLRTLMEQQNFSTDDVDRIVVYAPPLVRQLVDRPMTRDMTVNYARLCMPFLLATTLKTGTVGLDAYRKEALNDAEIAALAARITIASDGNADLNALRPQRIDVRLKNGQHHALDIAHIYGAPEAPLPPTAQHEKFAACCAHAPEAMAAQQIAALHGEISNLAALPDVSSIISLTVPHSP